METEIQSIRGKVEKQREEDKRFSDLTKKMEKFLTEEERKELEEINFNKTHNLGASLYDFGFVNGWDFLKEDILKLINKDIEYQKTKLTGDFEKDKLTNWRITGMEYLKKELNLEVRNSSQA